MTQQEKDRKEILDQRKELAAIVQQESLLDTFAALTKPHDNYPLPYWANWTFSAGARFDHCGVECTLTKLHNRVRGEVYGLFAQGTVGRLVKVANPGAITYNELNGMASGFASVLKPLDTNL